MAKRKLSQAQRDELRKAMSHGLKAGRLKGELVKEAAQKYGITTVTASWYMKSLNGGKKAAPKRKGGKAKKRRQARPAQAPAGNGILPRLVRVVESKAAEAAKRVKEARRLVPRLRALLKREHLLKSLESKVRRQLPAVSKKAKSLGNRIKALFGA